MISFTLGAAIMLIVSRTTVVTAVYNYLASKTNILPK